MQYPTLIQHETCKRRMNPKQILPGLLAGIVVWALLTMLSSLSSYAQTKVYDARIGTYVISVESIPKEIEEKESNVEFVNSPYQLIEISDSEYEELRWVLALEAKGEGLRGEIACCEAIFNRILSQKNDWGQYSSGGAVHGVLSKKGQFSTYKYIGSKKAWCTPGELEDRAISECLHNGPSVLPDMSYVYFDSCGGVNGKRKIKIGRHSFGAE